MSLAPVDTAMAPTSDELLALACPQPLQRPDLWPQTLQRRPDGELAFAGIGLTQLAQEQGTPAYVMDLSDLSGRIETWRDAMTQAFAPDRGLAGADIYYAAKAFICGEVCQRINAGGLGVDTASLGELTIALNSGVDPKRIGLHGNNKSVAALELACQQAIGRIIIDSLVEVDLLQAIAQRLAVQVPVFVRLTTGVHAGGHHSIATSHEDQKFGVSINTSAAAQVITAIAQAPQLRLVGLHCHLGSQIFDTSAFPVAIARVLAFRQQMQERGHALPEVDLGGGFPIVYTGADPVAPSPKEISELLAGAVKDTCSELGTDVPRISIEPGRSLVGPSTVTLYTVGTIKDVVIGTDPDGKMVERRYISIDGGMSDNIRPALYQASYTAALANRDSMADLRLCRVVGMHCESGDIVVRDVALPDDICAGDLLAVPATGAYGRSMASNYNQVPRPSVIGVEDDQVRTLIRRETVADLMSLDQGLNVSDPL